MGVLMQQHGTQVAVAQTDLALLSDRAGDGEGLEALADGSCTVGSALQTAFNGNGGAKVYAQTALSKQMAGCRG